ncbi:hypothetical protein ACQSSU_20310 [Micromonospora echinospora]
MTIGAHRLVRLHEAEEAAARDHAVWKALAEHVGGPVVDRHLAEAAHWLRIIKGAFVWELAMAHLARAAALLEEPPARPAEEPRPCPPVDVDLVDDWWGRCCWRVFGPPLDRPINVRAGERPARSWETSW